MLIAGVLGEHRWADADKRYRDTRYYCRCGFVSEPLPSDRGMRDFEELLISPHRAEQVRAVLGETSVAPMTESQWQAFLCTCGSGPDFDHVVMTTFRLDDLLVRVNRLLGETTTEWGVRWYPGDKHAAIWPTEATARLMAGNALERKVVRREVTPWVEVPSE